MGLKSRCVPPVSSLEIAFVACDCPITVLKRHAMLAERSKEVAIAAMRVLLASSSFLIILIDRTEPARFAAFVDLLLTAYLMFSLLATVALVRADSERYIPYIYSVDIAFPAVISIFTEGPNTPFYLFFLFALLSCAYRWGLKGTLQTAFLFVSIFLLEASALHLVRIKNYLQLTSDPNRLAMRSVYLLIMGFLIGFLAEEERTLREKMDISLRLLKQVNAESGLRSTVAAALTHLRSVLDCQYLICFCKMKRSTKSLLLVVGTQIKSMTTVQLQDEETERFDVFTEELFVLRKSDRGVRIGTPKTTRGMRLMWRTIDAPARLGGYPYESAIACDFVFGEHWSGYLFAVDPKNPRSFRKRNLLRFVIRQTLPSIYSIYLLDLLRERASQIERSRLTRALHDSTLNALNGIRMQLEAMRLSVRLPSPQARQIIHIEQLLREQAVELRGLMMGRDIELFDSESLPTRMQEVVRKIGREAKLRVQFVWDGKPLSLSNMKCRELVLAAREALSNIVRHSKADNAAVVLKTEGTSCILMIVDDGRGFEFEGTYSLSDLDEQNWGPLVVKEGAHKMGADLQLESKHGAGTTISIYVPQEQTADV